VGEVRDQEEGARMVTRSNVGLWKEFIRLSRKGIEPKKVHLQSLDLFRAD